MTTAWARVVEMEARARSSMSFPPTTSSPRIRLIGISDRRDGAIGDGGRLRRGASGAGWEERGKVSGLWEIWKT
jgi:hypothetical protein